MREKLIALLHEAEGLTNNEYPTVEMMADYLIEHGVTVKKKNAKPKRKGISPKAQIALNLIGQQAHKGETE